MYVKADRLTRMGWKPVHSDKISLLEALPAMIDAGVEDIGWAVPEPQGVVAPPA